MVALARQRRHRKHDAQYYNADICRGKHTRETKESKASNIKTERVKDILITLKIQIYLFN